MGVAAWSPTMRAVQAAFEAAHPFEQGTVGLGGRCLHVHVARTPQQWARGMVGQSDDTALLFILPPRSRASFHMREVQRDLMLGFFDDRGRRSETPRILKAQTGYVRPRKPYRYALEVPLSNRNGICALLGSLNLVVAGR